MEKNSVLGELLYIVSNYEKGRIKTNSIWYKNYTISLCNSLNIMEILIELLEKRQNIEEEEMFPVLDFINQNVGTIFLHNIDAVSLQEQGIKTEFPVDSCNIIINLMRNLVSESQSLLKTKEKKYKIRISYLLRAFHNLPKVFLKTNSITFFNLGIQPITKEDAMKYANSYLALENKATC